MDSPFYTNHWNYPTRRSYYYPTPTQLPTKTPAERKVVSIPVQYVGSERSRSESAVKIQKVFRGYLVRKSVKKIVEIGNEVNEIERRLSTEETMELIRRDNRERLRLNETLMNLLFKLDSVRGVDNGVRDCRKTVIKKAIKLQETIDAIVAASDRETTISASVNDAKQSAVSDGDNPVIVEYENTNIHNNQLLKADDHQEALNQEESSHAIELDKIGEDNNNSEVIINPLLDVDGNRENSDQTRLAQSIDGVNHASEPETSKPQVTEEKSEKMEEGNNSMEIQVDPLPNGENVPNQEVSNEIESLLSSNGENYESESDTLNDNDKVKSGSESEGERSQTESQTDSSINPPPDDVEATSDDVAGEVREEEDKKRSRELLEKMMEENEKMMSTMSELFERNEMQTRLLSSLSQRVEQLERAFICQSQRLRRKKKKNGLVE